MYGRKLSELFDDIRELKAEAPAVLSAEKGLDLEIDNGINKNQLHNGSHVKTRLLDPLNPNERQRVLKNFDGRFYERRASHHQYRVHVDYVDSKITLISEEMSSTKEHLCIDRPD